ncbi:MAG: toxin-antitoxin system YwqK family antitoxin [Bacteroidales bacterium]
MRKFYLTLSLLCLYCFPSLFGQDRVSTIVSDRFANTSSYPKLVQSFQKYIPIYENFHLEKKFKLTKTGDTITQYYLTDDYEQVYKEGCFINGKKNGLWKFFYFGKSTKDQSNRFALRSMGVYKNDSLIEYLGSTRCIKILSPGIDPITSQKVVNIFEDLELRSILYTVENGESKFQMELAALQVICDYLKESKSNAIIYHWKDDLLQEEKHITNGIPVKSTWYDITLDDLQNKAIITGKKSYINDTLHKEEYFYTSDIGGKEIKHYYSSGRLKSHQFFNKKNEKTGKWKAYHPNGQIQFIGKFKNGKRTGVWKTFDINGNLLSKNKIKK